MEEKWKTIEGYSGYEISNYGRVYSHKRKRLLKPHVDCHGYARIGLSNAGIGSAYRVHRLVLSHFIGKPDKDKECNHKDGVKTNNHYLNLEWVTGKENIIHSFAIGLRNNERGSKHKDAKLTEDDVKLIRTSNDSFSLKQLSLIFDVNYSTIQRIVTRVTWKHI